MRTAIHDPRNNKATFIQVDAYDSGMPVAQNMKAFAAIFTVLGLSSIPPEADGCAGGQSLNVVRPSAGDEQHLPWLQDAFLEGQVLCQRVLDRVGSIQVHLHSWTIIVTFTAFFLMSRLHVTVCSVSDTASAK